MTRDATAAAITESKDDVPKPHVLVELDFPGGFVRLNSTDRKIPFDSIPGGPVEEFLGVGGLGSISTVNEGSSLKAQGIKLTLSGIPLANIAVALQNAQRRPGKVWVGFFDSDYALVSDPVLVFSGLIDSTSVDLGEEATVTVFLESRLITWERPKVQRYTNEAQQLLFADDKFLEFVNQVVEKEILWGIGGDGVPRSVTVAAPLDLGPGVSRFDEGPFVGETVDVKGP